MWGGRHRGCGGPSGHSRPRAALPPFCSVVMEPLGWEGRVRLHGCEALLACDPPVIRREGANGAWRETASGQQIPISSSEHPHFWAPPCWPVSDSCLQMGQQGPEEGGDLGPGACGGLWDCAWWAASCSTGGPHICRSCTASPIWAGFPGPGPGETPTLAADRLFSTLCRLSGQEEG